MTFSCSSALIVRVLAISIDTCSACRQQVASFLFRKRHEQDGRAMDVGHGANLESLMMTERQSRGRGGKAARNSAAALIGASGWRN
jgi:hypothetical protein